ncbi:hypothetical protein ACFLWA_05860 [Chloroflexota bacterium]
MTEHKDRSGQDTQPISVGKNQGTGSEGAVPRIATYTSETEGARADVVTGPSQDEIATPTPIPMAPSLPSPQPPPRRGSKALWVVVSLSLALSLLSLALNAALIYKLLETRQRAIDGIDQAIAALDGLATEGFHYEFVFDQTIPFSGDIPFKQDIVFPFEGNIPFKSTVKVPVDMGILQTEIEVPVDTNVYISTSVPIHVDETIHVDTEIPVSMTIPIDIQPGDPEIQKLIDSLRERLLGLAESF